MRFIEPRPVLFSTLSLLFDESLLRIMNFINELGRIILVGSSFMSLCSVTLVHSQFMSIRDYDVDYKYPLLGQRSLVS
jgi:hypothetical protein